jgi:putative heme-binding domain-containing protein
MSLLAAARTQEEQLHYVLVLRNARDGWTMEAQGLFQLARSGREKYPKASFKRFLRIREDALKTMSDADRAKIEEFLKAGEVVEVVKETRPRQFVRNWQMQDLLPVIDQANSHRNFERGKEALAAAQCLTCHRFGNEGGATGPDLTGAGNRFKAEEVLESIILHDKIISDQYQNIEISTKSRDFVVGRIETRMMKVVVRASSPPTPSPSQEKHNKTSAVENFDDADGPDDIQNQDEVLDLIACFVRRAIQRQTFKRECISPQG